MNINVYYPLAILIVAGLSLGLILVSNALLFFQKKLSADPAISRQNKDQIRFLGWAHKLLLAFIALLLLGSVAGIGLDRYKNHQKMVAARQKLWPIFDRQKMWEAPDPYLAETDADKDLISYGRELIANTQDYYGKNGSLAPGAINGLNCQNCHLEAGSKPFGNNYFAVESTYPQLRARSGAMETVAKRINDCFQRSLNGEAIDSSSREMMAMMAYMRWLGSGVPKGEKPKGSGLLEVPYLGRAADPVQGQKTYAAKCASCHGPEGQGQPMPGTPRNYPPLWGDMSYNEGAGLFRLSRFAGYVKANMPFGASYQNPQLSDEEAWDLAAFVNSQPRPKHPFLKTDWPKIEKKPFDHPFGPFKDSFPEIQHKFGPFEPIIAFNKAQQKK